jgi:putative transposase
MPAYARTHQLKTSLTYHIYNRSHGKISIFRSNEDFEHFRNLLMTYSTKFTMKIYHWVIMPNHFHLLLEIETPESISAFMAGLAKAYSRYHHKAYSASGYLWQGRFKLQPVQKERYLTACGRYIERNPVRADLVCQPFEYPYGSARFYCLGESDGITTEDPTYSELSPESTGKRKAYIEFLRDFNWEEERIFDGLEQPVGNNEFLRRLVKEQGRFVSRRRGRPSERIVL